ncbi:LysR family transcriptional regulator [Vibrio sinaloensis]|nr:LysR family transcriptional regulator [Vibrio sinaloensis]
MTTISTRNLYVTQSTSAFFIAAAQEGSFSAAGRKLGISAAAVSKGVAALEKNKPGCDCFIVTPVSSPSRRTEQICTKRYRHCCLNSSRVSMA